tara:strand:+ start:13028 stop:14032 length:1005 start_codon:yes stop_codon:yes gene_type:complete
MANLGIIGSTTWGTTLAIINASKDHKVTLFARTKHESDEMVKFNSNPNRIPNHNFPESLNIDYIGGSGLYESEILILAVPSESFRKNICAISNNINKNAIIISASKGLEIQSGKRMSEIISDELPSINKNQICALSGPNLAGEILAGLPSSSVIACKNIKTAKYVQNILNSSLFRVYTNDDLIGVEIAGAFKNVIAIAAGISDGLKLGNNAKSAIITRGLAEMGRLGETLGARKSTFAGLSGMGDLIATCSSNMSRNYRAGEMIAQGQKTSNIIDTSKNVIEGIITTKSIMDISSSQNVELPLAKSVFDVLFNDLSPLEGVKNLMKREQTSEIY